MSTQAELPPAASPLAKAEAVADKAMMAAGAFGVVSVFFPALTLGAFLSVAVVGDWRGKLCLLGYLAVGVLGFLLGRRAAAARGRVLAALATAAVVLLLAVWLLVVVTGAGVGSVGIGVYLNLAAAMLLVAAAALKAKQARLF